MSPKKVAQRVSSIRVLTSGTNHKWLTFDLQTQRHLMLKLILLSAKTASHFLLRSFLSSQEKLFWLSVYSMYTITANKHTKRPHQSYPGREPLMKRRKNTLSPTKEKSKYPYWFEHLQPYEASLQNSAQIPNIAEHINQFWVFRFYALCQSFFDPIFLKVCSQTYYMHSKRIMLFKMNWIMKSLFWKCKCSIKLLSVVFEILLDFPTILRSNFRKGYFVSKSLEQLDQSLVPTSSSYRRLFSDWP